MKKTILFHFIYVIYASVFTTNAQPSIQWQKSFGGTNSDGATDVQQTNDGGYIVAGWTSSSDGDVTSNHGKGDYWIVKLNNSGSIQWQKCLGGTDYEGAQTIKQTTDSGYIVAGATLSIDGDVTGNHGDYDYWIVKLNSAGIIKWQKCLGGTGDDEASDIQRTDDGGYILAGHSLSTNGDVTGNHGSADYWIVKLDSVGSIQWQKSLGGTNGDDASSIRQTSDGGYIVAGYSNSTDGDVTGNHGQEDFWIVKLNNTGGIQWQKSFGGTGTDGASAIQQTNDGGYIVAGSSQSNDGDLTTNHGGGDCWIIKLSNIGNLQWQQSLGGTNYDEADAIQQTTDGGYIVFGYTESNDGNVTDNQGYADYWVVKLDATGIIQWQKSLGGASWDLSTRIQQTSEGGYIMSGYSASNDGDVTGNHGNYDYWIVKLAPYNGIEGNNLISEFNIYPNPSISSFTLELSSPMQDAEVIIYDMLGHEQLRKKLTGLKTEIQRGDLAAGVYFARVGDGEKCITQKIIVQ